MQINTVSSLTLIRIHSKYHPPKAPNEIMTGFRRTVLIDLNEGDAGGCHPRLNSSRQHHPNRELRESAMPRDSERLSELQAWGPQTQV
jgi:hypothetical protein